MYTYLTRVLIIIFLPMARCLGDKTYHVIYVRVFFTFSDFARRLKLKAKVGGNRCVTSRDCSLP